MIFRPTSADAVRAKPYAIKLANSLSGKRGVKHQVIDGFLLRAIGDGKDVIVYAIDPPIVLGLGVHGWVEIGLKAVDGSVFYDLGVRTLFDQPAGFVAPNLPYGRHSKMIEVVAIGGSPASLGEAASHYAGYSLENARSLSTTKAKYAQPGNNNPFRQPYLVIHRAAASLGAGMEIESTGTAGLLSSLGRVQIDIESLGTPSAGANIIPGEALEWGPAYGCGHFAQSTVDGYLAFYKITEQTEPTVKLVGEIQSLVDLPAEGFTTTTGITSASAMTGEFATDADRAVYFLAFRHLEEVQESVIHGQQEDSKTAIASSCGGKWYSDDDGSPGTVEAFPYSYTYVDAVFITYKRTREVHLVKALPDGTTTSVKLTERVALGPSAGGEYASFSTFPDGYELAKIGAVLAPEVAEQPRQALIIALRTRYVATETPEVPAAAEVTATLWACDESSVQSVLAQDPGHPATFTPTADTYEQAYPAESVAIIREDGSMQLASIPGYMPVGADERGGVGAGTTIPIHISMRYRTVACEYAADYFAVLVTPMPSGAILPQSVDWDFHVAVINKTTGTLHAVTPALGTYPQWPGQIAISCVEQGIVVDGAITQYARLLISVMESGSSIGSGTWAQPTTIYMLPGLTALFQVAATDYFAEAHYLGNVIAPAEVGRSTGMSSSRTGIGPVTPP